jgi:hypothetical protein
MERRSAITAAGAERQEEFAGEEEMSPSKPRLSLPRGTRTVDYDESFDVAVLISCFRAGISR